MSGLRADVSVQATRRLTVGCNRARTRSAVGSWRQLREALGLSIREVEEQTGINRGTLSQIERGFGPRVDHARTLLAFYDGAR